MKIDKFRPGLRILAESDQLVVGHEWETAFLIFKERPLREIQLGQHYGDPTCAVISSNNDWVVVGGEGLTIWRKIKQGIFSQEKEQVKAIQLPELNFIHAARIENDYKVRFLIDPWSANSGTWTLDLKSLKLEKISEGPDLREEPYREVVDY